MPDLILEARGLEYRYTGGYPALRGVDLAVPRGRKLALLGANGAGKTTLLLHLNGTLRPEGGEVRVHGKRVKYDRQGLLALRQTVGLVFQNPEDQLFAGTVFEDVSFGPMNLGLDEAEARARVEHALIALGITDLRDRPTHLLSFGQKKRAAIAGALAMRPAVMVLDEPTAGLDPDGVQQLLETLATLVAAGTTLVLATHDLDLAYAWADEVAILSQGTVLRQGEPSEVLRDADALAACSLRMPWVLEVALLLKGKGYLPGSDDMPKTREELTEFLERVPAIAS